MGGLKMRLAGSSMIEAIVASLIFLTVFVLSLSALTGLTLRKDEGYVLLEVERALAGCFLRYGDGTGSQGSYTEDFKWGSVTTTIETYGDYENIGQVVLRAGITGSRKVIEYRRLVVLRSEDAP
jgi:hypothetical protein